MLTPVTNNALPEPETEELIKLRKENQRLHAFAENFIRNKESEYKKQREEHTQLIAELRQEIATLKMDHETNNTALITVQQTLVKDLEEWKFKYLDLKEKYFPAEQLLCQHLNLSGFKDLSLWLETVYQPLVQENLIVKEELKAAFATLQRYELAIQTSEDQMKAIQQDLTSGKLMIEQAERYTQEMSETQHALEEKIQWLHSSLERKETEIHFLKSSLDRVGDMFKSIYSFTGIDPFKQFQQHWVPDYEAQVCQYGDCTSLFGLFKRRHHCRKCGRVICGTHYKTAKLNPINLTVSEQGFSTKVCLACLAPSSLDEDNVEF